MKKLTLYFLLITTSLIFPQTKYLIYFKDKGITPGKALYKTDAAYQSALKLLSARSIERREKVMGKNIITSEDIPVKSDYITAIENLGIKVDNVLNWFNAISAYLTDAQFKEISALSFVKSIDPVRILKFKNSNSLEKIIPHKVSGTISDSLYGPSFQEFNLSDIPEVYAKGITGKGVIIGILDDGFIWRQHESLVNQNVLAEYNYVFHVTSTAPQPGDDPSSGDHGTFVFSLIGGYKPGNIIGVAHDAKFILAKTEDDRSESHIEEDNYAAALEWMEGMGVDVTTSSLGYNIFDDTTYSYTYKDMDGKTTICAKAIALAFQRGVVTVTAAGNEGNNSWHYIVTPGDGINALTIGAVDALNQVTAFSSRGPTYDGRIKPELVALGLNNYGADVASGFSSYSTGSGTSFATPITAGIAALLLSAYPELTNVQVRQILMETADNYSQPNDDRGYGLVSAEKAISFPNLYYDSTQNQYTLNKIFFSNTGIQPSTALLHYSIDSSTFVNANLKYDDTLRYSYSFQQIPSGDNVQFYFTYKDSLGNQVQEPASQYFAFNSGAEAISLVNSTPNDTTNDTSSVTPQKVLGISYPNPFNPASQKMKIQFYSTSNQNAHLIIINGLGQVVKTLFNGMSQTGLNTVSWDGKSATGITCSSGVYFYILTLGGQNYSNKLLLLK
ncbi:MAG: S8 family serine peptidase [Ignavibacteriaceae bacterium]